MIDGRWSWLQKLFIDSNVNLQVQLQYIAIFCNHWIPLPDMYMYWSYVIIVQCIFHEIK